MKRILVIGSIAALSACTTGHYPENNPAPKPVLEHVPQVDHLEGNRPSVNPEFSTSSSVRVTLVVNKDAILSQEFLYGADLQYSSYYMKQMDLYSQSSAAGHIPARFRVAGNELQLIADNRRLYPSDVNHPEQLISRFEILAQDATTFTLSGARSGVFLAQLFDASQGDGNSGLTSPKAKAPKDSWIRSFDYDAKTGYLLQQTSVQMDDGTIAEVMESFIPRAALAPGPQFEKFEMNPKDPKGGNTPLLKRYRLLPGETIHDGEKILAFAQHFDISNNATIDWYVTRNIPDEYLGAVQEGVEGWNRYFRSYKGIERDVMKFKGRLPEGTFIGDPRYNVINWDSRQIAGAAYETQATDPFTGKQSHSLIYLPAAWLKIGGDYWTNGQFTERSQSVSKAELAKIAGKFGRLACRRELGQDADILASGRLSKDEVKTFGVELLKGVVLHEVGHALGLAHNFKGSLTLDRSKPDTMFSSSIMDYNNYELERHAFNAVDSAEGPMLEYDRQALSAIYNKQQDVTAKDPVLPTCNDEEADNEEGGVDPLCIRYDLERDPTLSVTTALDRIYKERMDHDTTLEQSIRRVPLMTLTEDAIKGVKTKEDLAKISTLFTSSLLGSMRFYILTSSASLSRVVRTNIKSLFIFGKDALPESYNAREMRARAFDGVVKALTFNELPANVKKALSDAQAFGIKALLQSPYAKGLNVDDQKKLLDSTERSLTEALDSFEKEDADKGLPRLRVGVLGALAFHKKVDFFLLKDDGIDYEREIVGMLKDATLGQKSHTDEERIAGAKALISFKGRLSDDQISETLKEIQRERRNAGDNDGRALANELYQILSAKASGGEDE